MREEILGELGVHYEASASEATAAATLAASVHYPIRGAVTFKSTVGTNVASDALANLASGGVTGGALVIVGEDYGEGSSIMQERSHAFAMKSQIWLLDPRPNLPSIVKAVGDGFALSEASNTPVMLQVRIRCCHVTGEFEARDNVRPSVTVRDALERPQRDVDRIVLPPASYKHEQEKISRRWPAAVDHIRKHGLNETFGPEAAKVGLIIQGGMYNGVIRALQRLGLADIYGETEVPIYCMNVTYPLIDEEILGFCRGKDAVLVVEEGQPELHRAGDRRDALQGRRHDEAHRQGAPAAGRGTAPGRSWSTGSARSCAITRPTCCRPKAAPRTRRRRSRCRNSPTWCRRGRPPFCTGCPERPIFAATKMVEEELGPHLIASDIGCHLFSINAPFDIGATTMGYGLGPASASAFKADGARRSISFIGDGGFWHNGLSSSIGNAVFNQHDGVIVIVDNYYSAATGGQDILSSRADNRSKSTNHPIADAVRGVGVKWVRHLDRTYDVTAMRDTLKDALTTEETGPKVIIASSECMLNRQRREKPQVRKAVADGKRVVRTRFGVDEDVCTGDHACIRLSGCPSLSLKTLDDPLRDDPVAAIDQSCVGCGNCGEVADAAVLCPSFYKADLVQNPTEGDQRARRWRRWVIDRLQARRERSRLRFAHI